MNLTDQKDSGRESDSGNETKDTFTDNEEDPIDKVHPTPDATQNKLKLIQELAATDKENVVNIEGYFKDDTVGGLAVALTHGSVMLECAKLESHATTALKEPDRFNPTRIGLVFYQHRGLTYANHGKEEWDRRLQWRNFVKYDKWIKGEEILSHKRVNHMRRAGFRFPEKISTVKAGTKANRSEFVVFDQKPGRGELPHSYWK